MQPRGDWFLHDLLDQIIILVKRPMAEIDAFFTEMENIFAEPDFTKEEVVMAIKRFIPNFEHEEKGKNLDQKM